MWPTVWELAPITSSWALAPNLLTQELQRQDYRELQGSNRVPPAEGLGGLSLHFNVTSYDADTVGPGVHWRITILVDREGG